MTEEIREGALLHRCKLTGRVYVYTRWEVLRSGAVVSLHKCDVTDEFNRLVGETREQERGE